MVSYTFNGKESKFKNSVGEVITTFKKESESSIRLDVKLTYYTSNTVATYYKHVTLSDNGVVQHYPIKKYAVEGIDVGEHNTTKKYFTHILGKEGYEELRKVFLKPYADRLEFELNELLGIK